MGPNNVGKSTFIDAIRVFWNDLAFKESNDLPKAEPFDGEVFVEAEFLLDPHEFRDLPDQYKLGSGRLKVTRVLATKRRGGDKKPLVGWYGHTVGGLSDTPFFGANSVGQGKLGNVIYIPAVSKLDDQTKLTGPSPLREVIADIIKKLIQRSSSFGQLKGAFEMCIPQLKSEQTDDGWSLDRLEQEVSRDLDGWNASFSLDIAAPDEAAIVKSLVGYKLVDKSLNCEVDPSLFGQGFQRHLIYCLIRTAAGFARKERAPSKTKEFQPELVLILFEEPEAFLHPHQQQLLDRSLRELASKNQTQVLISTHSPGFVSRHAEDLESIIKLRRPEAISKVGQVRPDFLNAIFEANQEINRIRAGGDLDASAETEGTLYFLWLNSERCSAFFASRVLLVEGPTEKALIEFLIDRGDLREPQGGVHVFDSMGKFNIHRFMNLFGDLGISHSVLFDKDGGRGQHADVARLLVRSSNAFTASVWGLDDKLETELGLPETIDRRKPQYVLRKARTGDIDPAKLSAFTHATQLLLDATIPSQVEPTDLGNPASASRPLVGT